MEVLGALVSVLSTWLVTGILLWEAVIRIQHPEPVDGKCENLALSTVAPALPWSMCVYQ